MIVSTILDFTFDVSLIAYIIFSIFWVACIAETV